jgi:hypothetical protein
MDSLVMVRDVKFGGDVSVEWNEVGAAKAGRLH